MKNKLINLLISILLTIGSAFLIQQNYFSKFKIDKISEKKIESSKLSQYSDLNNDGEIEEIEWIKNKIGHAIHIKRDSKYVEVINLNKDELFYSPQLYFSDSDTNGLQEMFFISVYKQAAYINIVEYNENGDPAIKKQRIYVDSIKYYNKAPDIFCSQIEFIDKDNIVFNISSGFTIQPRNIYTYNIKTNKITKSPLSSIINFYFKILKTDSVNYILNTLNIATTNTVNQETANEYKNSQHPDTIKLYERFKNQVYRYGDFSSYILLYNQNLNFSFPPIEHPGWTMITTSDFLEIKGKKNILSLSFSQQDTNYIPKLEIVDLNGKMIKTKDLKKYTGRTLINQLVVNEISNDVVISDTKLDQIRIFNNNLEQIKTIKTDNLEFIYGFKDLNRDSFPEFVIMQAKKITIFQNDFEVKTELPIWYKGTGSDFKLFDTYNENNQTFICIVIGDTEFILSYYKNNKYYFKYIIYLLILMFWYLFIWFVQKINSKRLEIENKRLEILVQERTHEIVKKNEELNNQQEEIVAQNEELYQSREEISAQRDAIKEKNTELEKLSIVASKTDNAVLIMDSDGNFEWANEGFERLFGCTLKEHINIQGNNMFEGSTNPQIKEIFSECKRKKKSVIYESKVYHISGVETWVQTTLTPILNAEGEISRLIAIDSDISKLKNAEENIKGSIRSAKTIQKAILPTTDVIKKHFDNFIIFRPKDIVSGDFYKYTYIGGYHFIVVVDCTGHGVPGAFMSMIGNSLLNEIINEKRIFDPTKILTQLNKGIVYALNQNQTDNSDGMDVCLCRIEGKDNSKVIFSGAKRDLIYYSRSANSIKVIKGVRKSIGGSSNISDNQEFKNHELILSKGDIFYLTTDGYVDQNNPVRKRFSLKAFIKILQDNAEKPLAEQKSILENALGKWQQNTKQRDDITVLGIKI